MAYSQVTAGSGSTYQAERAETCRTLATKADQQAAQATDPEMRATFLSMKELWLKLASEIDRRQAPTYRAS